MSYNPRRHHRRSIRLRGYDYSQPGWYFVTICVRQGECRLGEVIGGEMVLNDAGSMVQACWEDLPNHYAHVQLDEFVIMPNHVHGIIVLKDDGSGWDVGAGFGPVHPKTAPACTMTDAVPATYVGANPAATRTESGRTKPKRHGLSEIVRAFKTFSSRRINRACGTTGTPFWQRNYYERIIRDEKELNRARAYTVNNPDKWDTEDPENPSRWPGPQL